MSAMCKPNVRKGLRKNRERTQTAATNTAMITPNRRKALCKNCLWQWPDLGGKPVMVCYGIGSRNYHEAVKDTDTCGTYDVKVRKELIEQNERKTKTHADLEGYPDGR